MNENKQAVAVKVEDRFVAPRPAYTAPADGSLTTAQARDNRPHKRLVDMMAPSDNPALADKIAKAQQEMNDKYAKAKEIAEKGRLQLQGKSEPTPRRVVGAKVRKETVVTPSVPRVQFTDEDVCDDRTFIVRTRSSNIHTEDMKRLFWANGGEKYLLSGLSYASAFANMRNDKMKAITKK